jgi:NAD(P)H-flavin reductase
MSGSPVTDGRPRPTTLAADPWRTHPARVVALRDETPGVRSYDLELRDARVRAEYRFLPGQFNMLYLPGIGEAAISISSDPAAPELLTHTVRAVGNVTNALARLAVGDEILIRGPYGQPWPLGELSGGDVILVAGGLGLASQRAAILDIVRRRDDFGRVTILHGAKTPSGLLYTSEHDAWQGAGIAVDCTVDTAEATWQGPVGLVTDRLAGLPLAASSTGILCCGPDPMMTGVARVAAGRGLGHSRVWVSLERNMSCAVGQCGLCQFGPFFVCLDGPVFRYDRIESLLGVRCL